MIRSRTFSLPATAALLGLLASGAEAQTTELKPVDPPMKTAGPRVAAPTALVAPAAAAAAPAAPAPITSLQSPNGRYRVTLTDSGIVLRGRHEDGLTITENGIQLRYGPGGAGNSVTMTSSGMELRTGSASVKLQSGTAFLTGTRVTLGCLTGKPAARQGDAVVTAPDGKGVIVQGTTTVMVC